MRGGTGTRFRSSGSVWWSRTSVNLASWSEPGLIKVRVIGVHRGELFQSCLGDGPTWQVAECIDTEELGDDHT